MAELVVDLGAIAHNVRRLADAAAPAEVMAIVKADGYNHGLREVVETVVSAGASSLGVATVGEALAVRAIEGVGRSVPVTAWMWYPGEDVSVAISRGVTLGVPSLAHAEALIAQADAAALSRPIPATLMVDTGLSRSGVSPSEWESTVELLVRRKDVVDVRGLMSHLATADTPDDPAIDVQAQRFQAAIDLCRERGLELPCNHLANTPATLTRPDTHHQMVRPGVGVYGVDPVVPQVQAGLRSAMTLRARVITTRVVPAGEAVSYGHTWRADVDTRTAVVALGYADGIPRSASGRFEVSINGRRYPQIGRVCMDQIVVSVGPVDDPEVGEAQVRPGDWAVVFGQDGPTVDEFAAAAGTIAYEILTLPRGPRVRRRYLSDATTFPAGGGELVHQVSDAVDLSLDRGTVRAVDADAMRDIGRQIGQQLLTHGGAGSVVVLTGPLGAGKTTLTQGIAQGLGVRGRVQSPTFTIVRTHRGATGQPGLLHMDAYRLLGAEVQESIAPGEHVDRNVVLDALESLDLDADLGANVVVAEWGRGVVEFLSDSVLDVEIQRADSDESEERTVTWSKKISGN